MTATGEMQGDQPRNGSINRPFKNWKPSDLAGWLTRDVYVKQVQPALASIAKSRITFGTWGERTVLIRHPGRQAHPASTALADAGKTPGSCTERIDSSRKCRGSTTHQSRNPFCRLRTKPHRNAQRTAIRTGTVSARKFTSAERAEQLTLNLIYQRRT